MAQVTGKTLYEKVWDSHIVASPEGEAPVVYVDRHLVHEVTSPQAFSGLKVAGRKLRAPQKNLCYHGSQYLNAQRQFRCVKPNGTYSS